MKLYIQFNFLIFSGFRGPRNHPVSSPTLGVNPLWADKNKTCPTAGCYIYGHTVIPMRGYWSIAVSHITHPLRMSILFTCRKHLDLQ